ALVKRSLPIFGWPGVLAERLVHEDGFPSRSSLGGHPRAPSPRVEVRPEAQGLEKTEPEAILNPAQVCKVTQKVPADLPPKRLDGRIEMVDGDAEPYVQAEKLVDSLQLLRDERRDGGIRRFAGRICEANVRRLEGFVLVLLDIPSPKEIEHEIGRAHV